jgi:hypothetical protein
MVCSGGPYREVISGKICWTVQWRDSPGVKLGYPVLRGKQIREFGPPGCGSLKSETVKYGHESRGSQTWERLRWRGPAATVNYRSVFSSERASNFNKPAALTVAKIWSWAPNGYHTPGQTGQLTVGRNMTLTWTCQLRRDRHLDWRRDIQSRVSMFEKVLLVLELAENCCGWLTRLSVCCSEL